MRRFAAQCGALQRLPAGNAKRSQLPKRQELDAFNLGPRSRRILAAFGSASNATRTWRLREGEAMRAALCSAMQRSAALCGAFRRLRRGLSKRTHIDSERFGRIELV
jgi:hypothetical protein